MDLFVYGTLLFPEVLDALLGRVPPRTPATAPGWRVAALPGRLYPGLVADQRATARGMVLGGLGPGECALLDAYEGADYARTTIALAGGRTCATYVWLAGVLREDWDPDGFAAAHLGRYAGHCAEHRARWRTAAPATDR